EFEARMRAKLGLADAAASDRALIEGVLKLLAQEKVDYTIFWRRLADHVAGGSPEPVRDLFLDRAGCDAWLLSFSERRAQAPSAQAADLMFRNNPKFVLRNHLGQQAIELAQQKDYAGVSTLLALLETPFEEHPGHDTHAGFPPDWASTIEISCSS
ncbi:MAG: protein adenylyltransferase SelO family protein, partial [Variovorax sp.]